MRLEQSIIEGLASLGTLPESLCCSIATGVVSTVDTQMIIDDAHFHALEQGKVLPTHAQQPLCEAEVEIERLLQRIHAEGFMGGNFHRLVRQFGSILFAMIASDAQQQTAASWHAQGIAHFGGFLMADAGGSSIQQWNTMLTCEDESLKLVVDKVWIIEGHKLDYASIVAATSQKLYPSIVLVPPDAFSTLSRSPVGRPFLDGTLQLGNVQGTVFLEKDAVLGKGSLASTALFLSKIRPRFVRALMGHVQWLASVGKMTPSAMEWEAIQALDVIATNYCHSLVERTPSLPIALALKFSANQVLLGLVASGRVQDADTRRDLMAFSRMEGSSYRCLFELAAKLRAR